MTPTRSRIIALMADGQRRTSYEIAAALWGDDYAPSDWFWLSNLCDRMACTGTELRDMGKDEHSRTVYVINPYAKGA